MDALYKYDSNGDIAREVGSDFVISEIPLTSHKDLGGSFVQYFQYHYGGMHANDVKIGEFAEVAITGGFVFKEREAIWLDIALNAPPLEWHKHQKSYSIQVIQYKGKRVWFFLEEACHLKHVREKIEIK